ncbi:hypothetical protein V6x_52430 [Gimesia chilikensis]|uniref:Uncharacterized protein n=1 Tax=Gimesia chilikensis TaxID=2605989 RepID=A0A517WJR6_9PLAN|nr:hypothetical protein V6x_52430 [Gimesia chilikensis]
MSKCAEYSGYAANRYPLVTSYDENGGSPKFQNWNEFEVLPRV